MLGDGELDRCSGEVGMLSGALAIGSAIPVAAKEQGRF